LVYGLFKGPAANRQLRERLTKEAEAASPQTLHRRLAGVDPATAARVHPNDTRRIVRALEVWELTGQPISSWQEQWRAERVVDSSGHPILCLDIPRALLYDRINRRAECMIESGLVQEVERLRRLSKPLSREAAQAVGYREIGDYVDRGKQALDETVARIQLRTRNFAKRQLTWFRHLPGCRMVSNHLTFTTWGLTME
jgi:tRNA dimethylallyltransferase